MRIQIRTNTYVLMTNTQPHHAGALMASRSASGPHTCTWAPHFERNLLRAQDNACLQISTNRYMLCMTAAKCDTSKATSNLPQPNKRGWGLCPPMCPPCKAGRWAMTAQVPSNIGGVT